MARPAVIADNLGLLSSVDDWELAEGAAAPLGASFVPGVQSFNFALYSKNATSVTLLLYRALEDPVNPVAEVYLDARVNRTSNVWHCLVPLNQTQGATHYAYRVDGPFDPYNGHRFDIRKVLSDPFARDIYFPPTFDREACKVAGPTDGKAPLGVLPSTEPDNYDWGGDRHLKHTGDTIVYELHVKGFTKRPNSGVTDFKQGTFAGLIEKIPYLVDLGITVVELLPVHQFDPQENNYWGYMTLNFFAPHQGYCADPMNAFNEFRDMVKACHAAGIEVWLDVVYNHTAEGDEIGPCYNLRGIDNSEYYLIDTVFRGRYQNDTGCGNTIRAGNPCTRVMIMESLLHFARNAHVNGFRFDLASILTRDRHGRVDIEDPPLISEISNFRYNMDVRLIAEAWDISSYQLGVTFPGPAWRQWNGVYRDDVRRFVKGDQGFVPAMMARIYGSEDLFPDRDGYRPRQSVNFLTAHDGFCLYDMVAYNQKHNWANGNHNNDGSNDNFSWNCGHEGDDGVPDEVMEMRKKQVKNFFAILMLSNGTPMFCAGDEFMNTQKGNNNPYNQDNEVTWLDWDLLEKNRDIYRFFKKMISFRKGHRTIMRSVYWRDDIRWHGVGPRVDTSLQSHTLAYYLRGATINNKDLYVMMNMYWEPLEFEIQEDGRWRRAIDTARPSPDDILDPENEVYLDYTTVPNEPNASRMVYKVAARSIVVLVKDLMRITRRVSTNLLSLNRRASLS